MTPIAAWLLASREAQQWTQDELLTRMRDEIGWAPHRPNYSKYETGKMTPEPPTLAKFVSFWAGHGTAGPDTTPTPPEPDLAQALVALTAELTQMRLEREAWTRGVVEVLRAYEAGQVPRELLDALSPQPRADARP